MNQRATETNLNEQQFEQLKELYINTIVDSMSMKDLVDYVKTDYYNSLDKYNEFDLFEDIKYTLDEEFLEEFIKQIKGKLSWQNVYGFIKMAHLELTKESNNISHKVTQME